MDEFPLLNLCTVTQSSCSCEVTKVSKKQAWLSHWILNFRAGCIGSWRLLALYHRHTLLTKSSTNHRGNNRCGCVSLLYRKSWLEISGQNESLLLIEKSPEAAVAIQICNRFIVALATADLEEDGKSYSWVISLWSTAARHCLIWASVVTLQSLTLGDGSESELFHVGFRCSLVQSDAILRNTSGHCRHCLLPVFKMWINVHHIL